MLRRTTALIVTLFLSAAAAAQQDAMMSEYRAFTADIRKSGHYVGGSQLEPTTSATTLRERDGRQVVLDAGMTELIRPALYGAWHEIVPLTADGVALDGAWPDVAPTRVEGPVCESTDALGTHDLPPLRRGDLVAIADAGAYAASQASRYNGRPLAPTILV